MGKSLNFVAIDFETANASRASACSVSMVRVENGKLTSTFSSLLRPTEQNSRLHPINFAIHGITREQYMSAPSFPQIQHEFESFVGQSTLVAHNATFDRSCLSRTAESWQVEMPIFDWRCTYAMSRKLLDLPYFKLPLVAEHLGIEAFAHHDSMADAKACAEIAIELANKFDLASVMDFSAPSVARESKTFSGTTSQLLETIGQTSHPDENLIQGMSIAFTGTLQLGERETVLAPLIESLGAKWNSSPKNETDYLVFGDRDPNYLRAGMNKSNKLQKAELLREKLGRIEIIDEGTFLTLLPGDIVSRVRGL